MQTQRTSSIARFIAVLSCLSFLLLITVACSSPQTEDASPDAGAGTSATTNENAARSAMSEAIETIQATQTAVEVSAADGGAPPTNTVAPAAPVADTPTATPQVLAEGPFAQITPATGGANTQVLVKGGGFPANTRVHLYLAGVVGASRAKEAPNAFANATTDGTGNFSMAFIMPKAWPNGELIEAGTLAALVATEDFRFRASTLFEYVTQESAPPPTESPTLAPPTPVPSPTSAPTVAQPPTATPTPARNPYAEVLPLSGSGNSQVTLRGGGFPATTNINVHLATFDGQVNGGQPARYGSAMTDGSGNFVPSFTMPDTWPDGSAVEAGPLLILVGLNDLSKQANAVFNYVLPTPTPASNPYAQIEPATGSANTPIAITGGGFPANTTLYLYLAGVVASSSAREAPRSYASATTDGNGNYRMDFVMPASWPDGAEIESGTLAFLVATSDYRSRASATFTYIKPTPVAPPPSGWRAIYYNNPNLEGQPVLQRTDAELFFNWGAGSPDPAINADNFSASWEREMRFEEGLYRFTIEMDNGTQMFINKNLILESWHSGTRRTISIDYPMQAGESTIRLDYFEAMGNALVSLKWERLADSSPAPTITPNAGSSNVLFSNSPFNNRRKINNTFCSGFESDCEFAGCARNYRLIWGPYCREGDYPYIRPGQYRLTFYGIGRIQAGATDFGATGQLFAFGQTEMDLPGSFTFCWKGRADNGFGFETIAQSIGVYAAIDWVTVEYLGEQCQ